MNSKSASAGLAESRAAAPTLAERLGKFFSSVKFRRGAFILLFLLPGLALFSVIYAYPLVTIFATSFTKWDYTNLANPKFLGFDHLFDNYVYIFTVHPYFKSAILNSLKWVCTGLGIQLVLALVTALLLSQKCFGWKAIRNIYMIPNIISAAAMCVIFLKIYDPDYGFINRIIRLFNPGFNDSILVSETGGFWAVTLAYVFFGGSSSILILARIFAIPPELYEAARIDGAGGLKAMWHITLPLIRGIIGTIAILIANSSFLIYNEIALITEGGPGGSTFSLSYLIKYLSTGSARTQYARANTVGVIQFIIGVVIVGGLNALFKTGKAEG